jgi:hypothetical protein
LPGVADRVMVAVPGTLKNAEWTGNPVRAEIARIPGCPTSDSQAGKGRCGC